MTTLTLRRVVRMLGVQRRSQAGDDRIDLDRVDLRVGRVAERGGRVVAGARADDQHALRGGERVGEVVEASASGDVGIGRGAVRQIQRLLVAVLVDGDVAADDLARSGGSASSRSRSRATSGARPPTVLTSRVRRSARSRAATAAANTMLVGRVVRAPDVGEQNDATDAEPDRRRGLHEAQRREPRHAEQAAEDVQRVGPAATGTASALDRPPGR